MSTASKISSFNDLPKDVIEHQHTLFALSHDFMLLEHFVKHCNDTILLHEIQCKIQNLIKFINYYETKRKEDSSVSMETN